MEGASKLLAEMISHSSTASDFFGEDILKSSSISIDLPEDALGFWLTQGIPFGVFLLHFITAILGEREMGRCFVNSIAEGDLPQSQQKFITEFCLDQARAEKCNKSLPHDCDWAPVLTPCDIYNNRIYNNRTAAVPLTKAPHVPGLFEFNSLLVYRYHLWFVFIFIIIRALPRVVWRRFCRADIQKAINSLANVAEFQHAMQGLDKICNDTHAPAWMETLSKIGLDELELRVKRKSLFFRYTSRKLVGILLDVLLVFCLIWVLTHHTPFGRLTFVCDLHHDLNNKLICKTIREQYVTCTLSFGMEFVFTIYILATVLGLDCIVQFFGTVLFTKVAHGMVRKIRGIKSPPSPPLFLDTFLSKELELNKRVHSRSFYTSPLNSPNDLYLIGKLYRQSNVPHGHFLKMIAKTMMEELRPGFEHMKQNPPEVEENPTPAQDIPTDSERGPVVSSFPDSGEFSESTDNLMGLPQSSDAPVI